MEFETINVYTDARWQRKQMTTAFAMLFEIYNSVNEGYSAF